MDTYSIRKQLRRSELPDGVSAAALDEGLIDMVSSTRNLVVADQCGGLPWPGSLKPTRVRRLVDFLGYLGGVRKTPYD